MKKFQLVLIILAATILSSCGLGISNKSTPAETALSRTDLAQPFETIAAGAATQTASLPASTPTPEPTSPFPARELKPPDSDTPASGICFEMQDDPAEIVLGTGPDGLPLAGRCITLHPKQRLRLINRSNSPLAIQFADLVIDLPAGNDTLLERPVGEYFAPGVHFLPMGPELWVKAVEPSPTGTVPSPLLSDENRPAISFSLDFRTLDQILSLFAREVPDATREDTNFSSLPAIKFTYSRGRNEY